MFAALALLCLAQGEAQGEALVQRSPAPAAPTKVVSFGIITDVHYADAAPSGTRVYRDSLPKVAQAVKDVSAEKADFMIELGDFKDTDVSQHCDKDPSPHCVNITVGFLRKIESEMHDGFRGPKYHVLGNHDVDVLNQSIVLANENNSRPVEQGGDGYYSWSWPLAPAPPGGGTNDTGRTVGCLAREKTGHNTWIVHADGTRNWLQYPTAGCAAKALPVASIDAFRKRDGGSGKYTLDKADSTAACGNAKCARMPAPEPPLPPPPNRTQPVRFVVLNADYTDHDRAWKDLDNVSAVPGESWSKSNVPTFEMTWLATQLEAALKLGQRVVVFVHYRLDGNGGSVGKGLGPSAPPANLAWVDDCTVQNAASVRALLEHHPGLVLATFSGHDHAPKPPWTQEAVGKPAYFTHSGLVEGHFPASNAYSVVTVNTDCSLTVKGFGNATSATLRGPAGCTLSL